MTAVGAIAYADNSMLTSAYIQLSNARFCGQVSKQDLKNAGFSCDNRQPILQLNSSAWSIYEWNVFQLAAERQVEKNNCLTEQVSVLVNDKSQFSDWNSRLIAAWLGQKKSELIINKCGADVYSRLDLADVKRYGVSKAYENSIKNSTFHLRKPLEKEWLDLCFDDEKISALRAANSLFQFSLPVVSDPALFKTLERHRKMLVNTNTGKPLSDADILNADLQDLSFLTVKKNAQYDKDIIGSIQNLSNERTSITEKIKGSKTMEGYQLDTQIRDYLFEDETVDQVMSDKNLKYKTQIETGDKKEPELSAGAFCLMSKYEPNFTGEMVGLAVESAVAGGVVLKVWKGAKYLAGLSKTEKVKQSMGYGLKAVGYPMMAAQIAKSCPVPVFGNEPFRTSKVVSGIKNENMAFIKGADLPDSVGYGSWNLKMDTAQAPSCKTAEQRNLMLNNNYSANCIFDTLLTLAPLKIALPAMLYNGN